MAGPRPPPHRLTLAAQVGWSGRWSVSGRGESARGVSTAGRAQRTGAQANNVAITLRPERWNTADFSDLGEQVATQS